MTHYGADGLNRGSMPLVGARELITPAERFFLRSHAEPPQIDPATWRLEVGGLVERTASYSLADLERFPRRELPATLLCAGLRRDEFLTLGPLPGELPWRADAASTGHWRGISLADVLATAGPAAEAGYVELEGLDQVERHGRRFGFGGSVPLAKATSGETLLATHLNGAPLPASHGFPLRAVVPGWIGARSVKWLGRLTVRAEPSANYFQTEAYRFQRHRDPGNPRSVAGGHAMEDVPLNAVIVEPAADSVVAPGPVAVRGWAIGSGCRPLWSVEVTREGGSDWTQAELLGSAGPWSWVFWEARLTLEPGAHVLLARATDERGTMPASVAETWNVKGYGNNAWFRLRVTAR